MSDQTTTKCNYRSHYQANDDHFIMDDSDIIEPGDVDPHGNHYDKEAEYEAEQAKLLQTIDQVNSEEPF